MKKMQPVISYPYFKFSKVWQSHDHSIVHKLMMTMKWPKLTNFCDNEVTQFIMIFVFWTSNERNDLKLNSMIHLSFESSMTQKICSYLLCCLNQLEEHVFPTTNYTTYYRPQIHYFVWLSFPIKIQLHDSLSVCLKFQLHVKYCQKGDALLTLLNAQFYLMELRSSGWELSCNALGWLWSCISAVNEDIYIFTLHWIYYVNSTYWAFVISDSFKTSIAWLHLTLCLLNQTWNIR